VQSGELDFAFVSLPPRLPKGLTAKELFTEPIMLVCRPDHRLANRTEVSLDDLADETFVGAPPGSVGFEAVDSVFAATGTERKVPFVVNDVITIQDFVAHGLGIALLQKFLATSRSDLRSIPIAHTTLSWTLGAITPNMDREIAGARVLLKLLSEPRFSLYDPLREG
jgi:DNA-binding transcriptional LysR family regulator